MAADGAGAITSAMEEHQNAGGVAAGHARPLSRHAAEIDRFEVHVGGRRPDRADFVEALTPLRPANGTWLGRQQRADCVDFALSHRSLIPVRATSIEPQPIQRYDPLTVPPARSSTAPRARRAV